MLRVQHGDVCMIAHLLTDCVREHAVRKEVTTENNTPIVSVSVAVCLMRVQQSQAESCLINDNAVSDDALTSAD